MESSRRSFLNNSAILLGTVDEDTGNEKNGGVACVLAFRVQG